MFPYSKLRIMFVLVESPCHTPDFRKGVLRKMVKIDRQIVLCVIFYIYSIILMYYFTIDSV